MPDLWTTAWVIITVFRKCCPDQRSLTGASARLSGGFIYNTRNSNNPVSGKADFDLNPVSHGDL
ncbi:MAG: hypothetical protein ACLR6J_10815 [Parabacteroides merdae]